MIKVALFAGTHTEAQNYIKAHSNEFNANEIKYIRNDQDIHGIEGAEIVMHGTYYEKGQWYTELADKLEKLQGTGDNNKPKSAMVDPTAAEDTTMETPPSDDSEVEEQPSDEETETDDTTNTEEEDDANGPDTTSDQRPPTRTTNQMPPRRNGNRRNN